MTKASAAGAETVRKRRLQRRAGPDQVRLCPYSKEVSPYPRTVRASEDGRMGAEDGMIGCRFPKDPPDCSGGSQESQELRQSLREMMMAEAITLVQHPPRPPTVCRTESKLRFALHLLVLPSAILFHNLWV